MRRIARRIAQATGCAILTVAGAGCGAARPADATPERRLTAAVLSEDDMPAGYLPAGTVTMFQGLRPVDPDCHRLFVLAGAPSLGGAARAHTAFYQVDPGASVTEHLLWAPPIQAHELLAGVRRAAAGCDHIASTAGSSTIRLRRAPLTIRGVGEESYTVRYAGSAGTRHRFHVDIVMSRVASVLLVLTSETLLPPRRARDVAAGIAERAVGKLLGPASIG
jgi:hypothetical protein